MLRPRITPCLLVHQQGLWKTTQFGKPRYVGDPINAVRIFNEKEVDEIIVLDIDASRTKTGPNMELIRSLAAECRMPLCYGGGITAASQVSEIIGLGVEKVAISDAAFRDPKLIGAASGLVGRQSVVAVIDVKRTLLGRYTVQTLNGTNAVKGDVDVWAKRFEDAGAGEIVVNSIDRDGTLTGYDLDLIDRVRQAVDVPMTALGGAGSHEHLRLLFKRFGNIGGAAGSLFVFKGKYRAVLISYPTFAEKQAILNSNH
jgi:cyclase